MTHSISGDIYDYPRYYDMLYNVASVNARECDFIEACVGKYGGRCSRLRLLEPACGTGRLMLAMARRGHKISGCDFNVACVKYCNERLLRYGYAPSATLEDMCAMNRRKDYYDGAFNLIDSFRHILDESRAISHLRCVADALKPGGIYLLGIHLIPPHRKPICDDETWCVRRGVLHLEAKIETTSRDWHSRIESALFSVKVTSPKRSFILAGPMYFAVYTHTQFTQLLMKETRFQVIQTYGFNYNLNEPVEITPETEDVVYVLRKVF